MKGCENKVHAYFGKQVGKVIRINGTHVLAWAEGYQPFFRPVPLMAATMVDAVAEAEALVDREFSEPCVEGVPMVVAGGAW